jgi:ATP-binding protein involved in chromosome partitioning
MFKQVKVDVLGIVENMSFFTCPHCHHEVDIFSKGGGERTAQQFGLPFLGQIEIDPDIRKGGDTGNPVALAGEAGVHAKSLYDFARRVRDRVREVRAAAPDSVIEIQ